VNDEDSFTQARLRMVHDQIEARGLRGQRCEHLLAALRSVPRHKFVPESQRRAAYQDGPLPIGFGQTISQPYIVALMTDLLELSGAERVLEIGTGSGYQAAVLSLLADRVYTIERHAPLADRSAEILTRLGYANVSVHCADGSLGWPNAAPFDAILVAAAAPSVPQPLLEQLAENGRLVIPLGGMEGQDLQSWRRRGSSFVAKNLVRVSFVPLRGQGGWSEGVWQNRDDAF
jgi:protein-L-isoaspartate(D-aspartate) O-methyltransferase